MKLPLKKNVFEKGRLFLTFFWHRFCLSICAGSLIKGKRIYNDNQNNKREKEKKVRGNKGFTLIELVMIIVILGILSVVAIPRYINMEQEARQAAAQGYIGALESGLSLHVADHYLRGTNWVKSGKDAMDKLMESGSEMPDGLEYSAKDDRWTLEGEDGYAQFVKADDEKGTIPHIEFKDGD